MLRNYYRQLLAFILFITSIAANGQGFGVSTSARYADGCRLDFYNSTNAKIFSLRGSELRYTYNSSGQIIVRDENTQITDVFGISGLAALIDSVQSVCLAGLCSGGSTPVETFSYCGNTIGGYFYLNDTINSSPAFDNFVGFASFKNGLDTTVYLFATCSNEIYEAAGSDFTNYDFQNTSNIGCNNTTSLNNGRVCDSVKYYNLQWKTYNWTPPAGYYQQGYPQSVDGNLYDTIALEYTTKPLLYTMVNVNNDTSITNEYTVDFVVPTNKKLRIKRILGVTTTGLSLDTTNSTLTVTAKPVKTSGQTYATSSFKIEKITFADIYAPTISGSTYNPNLGEQTLELPLTTGKNTFKVSVEDTDGNIAYSIFQVSKTAL